jgi:magnesium transporter
MKIEFLTMISKRAGWLCALFLSEMLTVSAMQYYRAELEKAIVLTRSSREINLKDWWRIAS